MPHTRSAAPCGQLYMKRALRRLTHPRGPHVLAAQALQDGNEARGELQSHGRAGTLPGTANALQKLSYPPSPTLLLGFEPLSPALVASTAPCTHAPSKEEWDLLARRSPMITVQFESTRESAHGRRRRACCGRWRA
jgi:hypothetical protein